MVKRFLVFAALAVTAVLLMLDDEDEVARLRQVHTVQNAHDLKAMRSLLADIAGPTVESAGANPSGVGGGLKSLEERYKGTWRIDADRKELRIISVSRRVAQVLRHELTVGRSGVDPPRPGSTSTS